MESLDDELKKKQAQVNAELWRLASTRIVKHGDLGALAKELGMTRQTLRNIELNHNHPSGVTINKFKRVFPSLDVDAITHGDDEDPDPTSPPAMSQVDRDDWKAIALEAFRDRDEKAKEIISLNEELKRLYSRLLQRERPDLFEDKEGAVKLGSDSQITAIEDIRQQEQTYRDQIRVLGFVANEAKVIKMVEDTKVYKLNSRPVAVDIFA